MSLTPRSKTLLITVLFTLASACGSKAPTGVETDDVQGTWSGTFSEISLLGRTLSGDADWTFNKDTFEIIFFNPPDGQAERISGDWKFADGRIALTLKSSFPIDNDIGATDTLFVSILRDEMSIKTIAESSLRLVKTRLTVRPEPVPSSRLTLGQPSRTIMNSHSAHITTIHRDKWTERADIRFKPGPQHTST